MSKHYPPPRIARRLIRLMKKYEDDFQLEGDLHEVYDSMVTSKGLLKARLWYWKHSLKAILPYFQNRFCGGWAILKNYGIVAFRNIGRHKLHMTINISGLALGLAVSLVVLGYVSQEFSFESSHKNRNRIVRVNARYHSEDMEVYSSRVMPGLGREIRTQIPEVDAVTIFRTFGNVNLQEGRTLTIDRNFSIQKGYEFGGNVLCADSGFPDVFTIPLSMGDAGKALAEPFSMIISEKAAGFYFPAQNPMGQIIALNDSIHCQVTGVMKNLPQNTQLYCDFILSYATLERIGEANDRWDTLGNDFVYLLLRNKADRVKVLEKIASLLPLHVDEITAEKFTFELQPLKNIYFSFYGSGRQGDLSPHGESSLIYTIAIIALFILMLAVTNYINLSTARAADRMKEVGLRKVFGAHRTQLIRQFLSESILMTGLAVLLSMIMYFIFIHSVNPMLNRPLFANFLTEPAMLFMIAALVLTVGLVSGLYPALVLSRFQPRAIFQSGNPLKSSRSILRKMLVVVQFAIAVGFICSTAIIYRQLDYLSQMDMGFENENMLILDFTGENASQECLRMKNEILRSNQAQWVTALDQLPGLDQSMIRILYLDETRSDDNAIYSHCFHTDYDFLSTFKLELTRGRAFSPQKPEDDRQGILINESALASLNITDPIGHRFYSRDSFLEIIGVFRDFQGSAYSYHNHTVSIIMIRPDQVNRLAVKLKDDRVSRSVQAIGKIWNDVLPEKVYDYRFLDEMIRDTYSDHESIGAIMLALTLLTILIACMGIFALVSFTAEQKTKEIGIRKVLGASVGQIIILLGREFVLLILMANAIAWPLSYLLMQGFLMDFSVKAPIGIGLFLFTGGAGLLLALLTASFQSVKAAHANPVHSLQYE